MNFEADLRYCQDLRARLSHANIGTAKWLMDIHNTVNFLLLARENELTQAVAIATQTEGGVG